MHDLTRSDEIKLDAHLNMFFTADNCTIPSCLLSTGATGRDAVNTVRLRLLEVAIW